MAKTLTSPQQIDGPATLADDVIDQMFGYYSREPQRSLRPANDGPHRVISELDAAGAILAARRAA